MWPKKHLQEQVKKVFCFKNCTDLFLVNCSSNLKHFAPFFWGSKNKKNCFWNKELKWITSKKRYFYLCWSKSNFRFLPNLFNYIYQICCTSYFFQHSISDSLSMVSPQMMKLMIGFVENNALAGNYTDPDTEEIIVVEGEEQWKGICNLYLLWFFFQFFQF